MGKQYSGKRFLGIHILEYGFFENDFCENDLNPFTSMIYKKKPKGLPSYIFFKKNKRRIHYNLYNLVFFIILNMKVTIGNYHYQFDLKEEIIGDRMVHLILNILKKYEIKIGVLVASVKKGLSLKNSLFYFYQIYFFFHNCVPIVFSMYFLPLSFPSPSKRFKTTPYRLTPHNT